MKKIGAFWEKRNLNLNTLELELDEDDSIDSICETIKEMGMYNYVLAKVPKRKINIVHYLESLGFNFMEAQILLYNNLNRDFPLDNYIKKVSNQIDIKQSSNKDCIASIIAKIDDNMFDTDRISLDPLLGKEFARKRYINWILDEYENDKAVICEIRYKSNNVGFFMLKKIDSVTYYAALAGLYSDYKNLGLGFSIIERPITWCRQHDIKRLIARVASNNLESLRLHLNLGYEITDIYYTLRRINCNKEVE